jgi:hypothetical protein
MPFTGRRQLRPCSLSKSPRLRGIDTQTGGQPNRLYHSYRGALQSVALSLDRAVPVCNSSSNAERPCRALMERQAPRSSMRTLNAKL